MGTVAPPRPQPIMFTGEQISELIRLYTVERLSLAQIAKLVGYSIDVVRSRLLANGVVMRPRHKLRAAQGTRTITGRPLAPFVLRELGRCGISRSVVCTHLGIQEKQLYTWERENTGTDWMIADRVLLGLERNWWEVYDPQAHKPGLFCDRQRDDVLAWLDVVDRASWLWAGERLLGPDDPYDVRERAAALEWAAAA